MFPVRLGLQVLVLPIRLVICLIELPLDAVKIAVIVGLVVPRTGSKVITPVWLDVLIEMPEAASMDSISIWAEGGAQLPAVAEHPHSLELPIKMA